MMYQTASILQSKSTTAVKAYDSGNRSLFRSFENDPREEKRSYVDSNADVFDDRRNDEIWNEIQELRNIVSRQNEKIRRLEEGFDSSDTNSLKIESTQQRIDQLESDIQSCTRLLTGISRENADHVVQAKSMSGRLHWVEDMVRASSQDFVSKSSFSQLLDTCTDQLKTIHMSTETARSNSQLCISFIESLLAAFGQLQGTQPVLGLEHLMGLSGYVYKRLAPPPLTIIHMSFLYACVCIMGDCVRLQGSTAWTNRTATAGRATGGHPTRGGRRVQGGAF